MQVSVWSLSLASQTLVNFSVSQSISQSLLKTQVLYILPSSASLLTTFLIPTFPSFSSCCSRYLVFPPWKLNTPCFFFSGMFVPRNPCDSVPYLLWSLTNYWFFREASSVHPVPNGTPSLALSLSWLCFVLFSECFSAFRYSSHYRGTYFFIVYLFHEQVSYINTGFFCQFGSLPYSQDLECAWLIENAH